MSLLKRIKAALPPYIWYILGLIVSTRIVLTAIGIAARYFFNPKMAASQGGHLYLLLDVWRAWDSDWYYSIAAHGYSTVVGGQQNYNFFPLYPLLMKIVGFITWSNYYLAGAIISNIALVIACVYLYKLMLLDCDDETALRSVKYMIVFPTAFFFSAVMTEGLFVMLALMGFYYARKSCWLAACIAGFFLTLTRPVGVLMAIPLVYIYLKERKFAITKIDVKALWLLLIPFAMLLWMSYNYHLVGDPLGFLHMREHAWGYRIHNPVQTIWSALQGTNMTDFVQAVISILTFVTLCVFAKKIGFTFWLYSMVMLAMPLTTDLAGMERLVVAIFPLYILFAKLGRNEHIDNWLTIWFAMFQALFMMFWAVRLWIAV